MCNAAAAAAKQEVLMPSSYIQHTYTNSYAQEFCVSREYVCVAGALEKVGRSANNL
jgi:hypothetical protein